MIKKNSSALIYAVFITAVFSVSLDAQIRNRGLDSLVQVVTITVPDLYGKSLDEALEILKANNLIPGTTVESKSTDPEGTIIAQSPEKGKQVFPQTKIDLTISQRKIIVPDLIGRTPQEAARLLKEFNLQIRIAGNTESDIDPGKIASQNPEKGRRIYRGEIVSVFTAVPILETVPPLSGHTVAEAGEILTSTHLTLGSTVSILSDNGSGNIIDQNPPAGIRVKRGSPVSVTIAIGPEKVKVPKLTGLSKDKAEGILIENRLTTGNINYTNRKSRPGRIIDQYPLPGAEANVGSAVNIFIQEYRVVLIPDTSEIDSGQAVEFRVKTDAPAGNAEYQFHYGDGTVSDPTNLPESYYVYKTPGTFNAYVTVSVDRRIIRSDEIEISVIPADETSPFWYIAGGAILLGGSGIGLRNHIRNKKIKELLKKSVRQYKGPLTSSIDLKDAGISVSLKLRAGSGTERISSIKFK